MEGLGRGVIKSLLAPLSFATECDVNEAIELDDRSDTQSSDQIVDRGNR